MDIIPDPLPLKPKTFGFIITRHVNSIKTNRYWNKCIQCIQRFYPDKKIIIIDDNSNRQFLKENKIYENVEYIYSEFPGRGELLPYYYFYKHHFFDKAIILHDSVFFQKKIHFEKIKAPVMPLWHFKEERMENQEHSLNLIKTMENVYPILSSLTSHNDTILSMKKSIEWFGCFGVQSMIQHSFIVMLQKKYNIFNLLTVIKTRKERCCLERIMGILFYKEYPYLLRRPSLLGVIHHYMNWGYTIDEYERDCIKKCGYKHLPLIKVWTGR